MLFWFTALLMGCTATQRISSESHTNLYQSEEQLIKSTYSVYHAEKNKTVVYLRINASDLTPAENLDKFRLESTALVNLKVYPADLNLKKAVDSVYVKLIDQNPGGENHFLHSAINLAINDGFAYRAVMTIKDANSSKQQTSYFDIEKRAPNHRQNFLVFQTGERLPHYDTYVTEPTRLRIKNNQNKDMQVRYYNRSFPLPPPPFSSFTPPLFQYQADSLFTLRATSDFSILNVNRAGFYHLLADENQKAGLTIFTFPDPFPEVSTTQQMFEALRYVTTEWEYREMRQKQNLRLAVEKFWIECAGSKEKAREMIQTYYGRVEEANNYFTSYTEGWRTDRGLIHVVYGHPNIIQRTPQSETWIYGEDKNAMSLSFTFVKVINPFTDNDYRLNRDDNYKASWYRAIESWRNGRIYAN